MTAGMAVSITISPVPKGVNGTDTKHYLYVAGGSGSPEAVLITGGTATSGSLSGTLSFTPASSHSGAWTVSSTNGGIAEAMQSMSPGGGVVGMPSGTYTIRGPVGYLPKMTFLGAGPTTILVPGSSASIVFDGNVPHKGADEFSTVSDISATAALVLPIGRRFVQVQGTTTITSFASVPPEGSVVTLRFVSSLTISSGTRLRLNSNFVSTNTAYSTLTFYSDGTTMIEISRSAN